MLPNDQVNPANSKCFLCGCVSCFMDNSQKIAVGQYFVHPSCAKDELKDCERCGISKCLVSNSRKVQTKCLVCLWEPSAKQAISCADCQVVVDDGLLFVTQQVARCLRCHNERLFKKEGCRLCVKCFNKTSRSSPVLPGGSDYHCNVCHEKHRNYIDSFQSGQCNQEWVNPICG